MVKPGVNQVALMPRSFRNLRMRPEATVAPNSPRDSGVGVVMPRAMKPDWVSKSKVRQTMWRGILGLSCQTRRRGIQYPAIAPLAQLQATHALAITGLPAFAGNDNHRAWPLTPSALF